MEKVAAVRYRAKGMGSRQPVWEQSCRCQQRPALGLARALPRPPLDPQLLSMPAAALAAEGDIW